MQIAQMVKEWKDTAMVVGIDGIKNKIQTKDFTIMTTVLVENKAGDVFLTILINLRWMKVC